MRVWFMGEDPKTLINTLITDTMDMLPLFDHLCELYPDGAPEVCTILFYCEQGNIDIISISLEDDVYEPPQELLRELEVFLENNNPSVY